MRARTVEHSSVVFGQVLWGAPEIVVPLLPDSTFYADTIRCRFLPDGSRPGGSGPQAYVTSPLHVVNPDGSLTTFEVQGPPCVTDTTQRDKAALDAWAVWVGGYGVEDVSR